MTYEPGETTADEGLVLSPANASAYVKRRITELIESKTINPWCHVCRRASSLWFYDDTKTHYHNMQEAHDDLSKLSRANAKGHILASLYHAEKGRYN